MRKDKRNFSIEYLGPGDWFFCYQGKKCHFNASRLDNKDVFRYGDDFFLLIWNEAMGYSGFTLISKDCELIQDLFFQNIQEVFESVTGKKKDFFKYSEGYQADFISQWIQ